MRFWFLDLWLLMFFFLTWCPSVKSWWLFCNSEVSQIPFNFTGNWCLGWAHIFSHYLQYFLSSNMAEEKSDGNGIHLVCKINCCLWSFFLGFLSRIFMCLISNNMPRQYAHFPFDFYANLSFNINVINLSVNSDHTVIQKIIWERYIGK